LALDRQSIEKRDFPIGRRGYEPEAVDAHLASVADEMETLRRASRRRTESLASSASEQVRAIVEAAESSAAEIQRAAEEEAREIRVESGQDAEETRALATSQAREHVERVSGAADAMLQRLEAMDSELGALVESLRTGANRLVADLSLLQGNMEELRASAVTEPREPRSSVLAEAADEDFADEEFEVEEEGGAAGGARETAVSAEPAGGSAAEGARLIALNMALNGTPREETDRYLAENFELADRRALLDEVYARVQ